MEPKAESARDSSGFSSSDVAEKSEKEGLLTMSAHEAAKHSDFFSSSSALDRGTKGRSRTVLSLFDEEEDKTEEQSSIPAPQKEVAKGPDPDARPKSTGVFQDEELLFSHKLQKDNDPDVDLFAGTKNPGRWSHGLGACLEMMKMMKMMIFSARPSPRHWYQKKEGSEKRPVCFLFEKPEMP